MDCAGDFPILGQTMPGEHRLIYLDNASSTQVPESVLEVERDYYSSMNANPSNLSYALSKLAEKIYGQARDSVASFIGAKASEILFTQSATEAQNIIAYSWGLNTIEPDDEIAVVRSEHESCLLPWQMVARARGARMVYLNPDLSGRISDEELDAKIGSCTKAVIISHISHVFGVVYPLKRIIERAHEVGAIGVIDCALSPIRRSVDVKDLDADFAVFSGHKSFAPVGTGLLYVKEEFCEAMKPFIYGAGIATVVGERRSAFKPGIEKLKAGPVNVGGAATLAAAFSYLEKLGYEDIAKHDAELTEKLLKGIADMPRIRVYGDSCPSEDRCGIVTFNVVGINPNLIQKILDTDGIMINSGFQEASLLQGYLATSGMCRVSIAPYTTTDDVDAFLSGVQNILERISRTYFRS